MQSIQEYVQAKYDITPPIFAPIKLSNSGQIVYAKYTGIYGNVLIAYHGLGLFTLYAHCSNFLVKEDENIPKETIIAKTGATGAVFGDHLHFGVLIQGIEVLPLEWFDKHWLKDNIFKVINDAKNIINAM
jgi:murein DD-endopeptidase MepM/ murein hydrolase activator NlpD